MHFEEWWGSGLFFALLAPAQIAWAVLVLRDPAWAGLLRAGAVASLLVAALWMVTRTVGLPFGAHPGVPEPLGLKDSLATTAQLACAALAWSAAGRGSLAPLVPAAWALAAVAVLAALLPGGHG